MRTFVVTFENIDKSMIHEMGGKGAHLGELTSMKLNVPKGFSVVSDCFYLHLRHNDLIEPILDIAKKINYEDFQDLEQKTSKIRSLIESAEILPEVETEIIENYRTLTENEPECFVAVRSSVGIKNSDISSFPGMMDTYHFVSGREEVVRHVKRCWASVWSARATFARHRKGIDHLRALIAPIVQLMVNSEMAGVAFTVNPITGAKDEIVIEANWGLGESVVSGKAMTDLYIAGKRPFNIKENRINKKEKALVKAEGGGTKWVIVDPEKINEPTLTAAQVEELCRTALAIEQHYGYPQDIEWAYEKGFLYILQARRARTAGE